MARKATNLTPVVSVDLYIVIMKFTRNTFIWQTQPSSLQSYIMLEIMPELQQYLERMVG